MKENFFTTISDQRADRIAQADVAVSHAIRNHLVQLFRKAHKDEPNLTGVVSGMGRATPRGCYAKEYEDGETLMANASNWSIKDRAQPVSSNVRAFFQAVADYSDHICSGPYNGLPYIQDITSDDLKTRR